jgi:hypothetical protein
MEIKVVFELRGLGMMQTFLCFFFLVFVLEFFGAGRFATLGPELDFEFKKLFEAEFDSEIEFEPIF